ncbi:DMT family transporter [Octadecabacter sp. CECT 8868]|uniref:DMT family transporter n=1 Tax=Octadecabacter algicola TaxID=2909342 RepID=UPI001F2071F6|nr:DMT family transporter [Octadecabacter algicola]MCF2903822.1 DMT family transporter [Octadecabacter algicola]
MTDQNTAPFDLVGRGIVLMLLANLMFSFVDTSTKWLIGSGLMVIQLAFMRYATHFFLTVVEQGMKFRTRTALSWRMRGLVTFRAFCLVSATCVNFTAIAHLPLTVSSAILFLSPVFVCLFARPMLGEQITLRHWFGLTIGFFGVLIIVWPFGEAINWYAVLMIYPAAAMALYQVLTRKLSGVVAPDVLQFYTGALGTAALLPAALYVWVSPTTAIAWVLLFGIGAFAWAGHEAFTRAHAYGKASTLAPIGYSFVIYVSIAGWIVFGDVPTFNVVLGAIIIFGAGMFTWRKS